jgi:glutamyl-tRNA synthetase
MIRTRFAPSPTGELHIGSARTALFSYLFVKHQEGEFLLRIEDTDRERFVEGSAERILESLRWLGIEAINADEPMVQSKRLDIYKKFAMQLVEEGKAYVCTCTKEQLEKDRAEQIKRGEAPRYSGRCRERKTNNEKLITMEGGSVVRMKMPKEGKIVVDDLIHGKVEFDAKLIDDQVILKSDGYPTYHLAHVVDDHEMDITHVIRSDEWLPSTPKHIVLYEMFGWKLPEFAHLPVILGTDKKKMSKRHGATSVLDYHDQGYLPEALVNFIAFLGWNPKDERETFSIEELAAEFELSKVNKSPAIFDVEKLNSINESYIREDIKNKKSNIKNLVEELGIKNISEGEIELIGRGGYKTLKEAAEYIIKLRKEPEYKAELLVFKKSDKESTLKGLQGVLTGVQGVKRWQPDDIQKMMAEVVSRENLTNGDVFWPVRAALSGEERSPSPVELAVALGEEETVARIEQAVKKLA